MDLSFFSPVATAKPSVKAADVKPAAVKSASKPSAASLFGDDDDDDLFSKVKPAKQLGSQTNQGNKAADVTPGLPLC